MDRVRWALSWLLVGAVGPAPMPRLLVGQGDRASLPAQARGLRSGRAPVHPTDGEGSPPAMPFRRGEDGPSA